MLDLLGMSYGIIKPDCSEIDVNFMRTGVPAVQSSRVVCDAGVTDWEHLKML